MTDTANTTERTPVRREMQGVVVSDAMDKSIVVRVDRAKKHRRYHKVVRYSSKYMVHDERNDANAGDTVRFVACRPMSKSKRFRLSGIVERAR